MRMRIENDKTRRKKIIESFNIDCKIYCYLFFGRHHPSSRDLGPRDKFGIEMKKCEIEIF